jgi:cytochrome c biogenesis protein
MTATSTPPRLTLRQSVAFAWRTLRSMRTALVLLLLLAAASVAGSLLPQVPNSPERVQRYVLDHPFWGEAIRRAGLFDVFGSWWFALITVLLFTSLVACLLPRTRAHSRAIWARPVQARELDAFPLYQERVVRASAAETAAFARTTLRRRRFRLAVSDDGRSLAAEKGTLRELGSLVFHWAFVLLLVGVIVGKGTGYSGRAVIVEGQTWVDTGINYDPLHLRLGRFFDGSYSRAGIRLVRYADRYDPATGMPEDFVSTVDLLDPDGDRVTTADVRVNHPVSFEGLRIHQFGFGWAPVLTVRDRGQAIAGGPIVMGQHAPPEGVSALAQPWSGFVKLPQVRPQQDMAVALELWPDGRGFLNPGMPMFAERDPLIRYTVYQGKLLDPSLTSLDTRFMTRVADGFLAAGWVVDLEHGCIVSGPPAQARSGFCAPGTRSALTMGFPDLRRYTVLQVSHDATVPVVLVAVILILVGLLAALYTSRRKLWVRIEPAGDGSVVKVGGFALQRRSQFDEEFAKVVETIVRQAGGPVPAPTAPVGSR